MIKRGMLFLFIFYGCSAEVRRKNFYSDIIEAKGVCNNFLFYYKTDKSKAILFLEGVNYDEYMMTSNKMDSLFGEIQDYDFLSGKSVVEKINTEIYGKYEIEYRIERLKKHTKVIYYLEGKGKEIRIVGSEENW